MTFGKEVDLERDKRMYFQSVTRHMNENAERNQGMMLTLRLCQFYWLVYVMTVFLLKFSRFTDMGH